MRRAVDNWIRYQIGTLAKLGSRWVLIPLALFIGAIAGAVGGVRFALYADRDMFNSTYADQTKDYSDLAAQLDLGDLTATRDQVRRRFVEAVNALAEHGTDGHEFESAWRNVATYAALSPGLVFSDRANGVLFRHPAYAPSEIDASECPLGVRMLAHRKGASTRP